MSKYVYDVGSQPNSAAEYIIHMVQERSKVLELGAGPGSISGALKNKRDCTVHACEVVPEFVAILKEKIDRVIECDLNSDDWTAPIMGENYDFIVLADVLEHLSDPLKTLKTAAKLLTENSRMVISLPHAHHMTITGTYYTHDFSYQDSGLLDRTHIRFFGLKNMDALFEEAGLVAETVKFVIRIPEETELREQWSRVPGRAKRFLKRNRTGYIYQAVTLLRRAKAGEGTAGVKINDQKVVIPFKKLVRTHPITRQVWETSEKILPPAMKERIRKIVRR